MSQNLRISNRNLSKLRNFYAQFTQKPEEFELFNQIKNITELKQLPFFIQKKFRYFECFLIIHSKGESFASVYSTILPYNSNISVTEFTGLFQQIKKTRKKFQYADESISEKLHFTGYYQATTLRGHLFEGILITTRMEFMPPPESDHTHTKRIGHILPFTVQKLIRRESLFEKNRDFVSFLKKFPTPIVIENKYNELVFKNNFAQEDEIVEESFDRKNLRYSNLLTSKGESSSRTAEVFHQERVQLLGELLNTLKHELSNPLFGIRLSTELLIDNNYPEPCSSFLEQILQSTKRCEKIIQNMTNLYAAPQTQRDIRIQDILSESITLAKSATRAIKLEIIDQLSSKDSLLIQVHPTWIIQIIFNLLINSSQALKKQTSPIITITLFRENDYLCLSFLDNGPGISLEHQSKLFETFFTTKMHGTGLGLAISKSLALKMGGDLLCLKSDSGAHFKLLLKYK